MSLHDAVPETSSALGAAALKGAPPLLVSGATLLGVPVADWIQYITLVYVLAIAVRAVWPALQPVLTWARARMQRPPRTME